MALISWEEKYSVNVKEIDEQHKKLVKLVNDLHEAMSVGKGKAIMATVLQSLIDYTATHFAAEEKYMTKFNYPAYPQHKSEHDKFVKQVLDFQKGFAKGDLVLTLDVMKFLKDWLLNHILGTDKKFGPFFNEKDLV